MCLPMKAGEMTYAVALDDNEKVKDIVAHMPLDLSMVRYAGHEYYAKLPYTPVFDENRTSDIKVVHIEEITDSYIVDTLINANENIDVQVTN